jgi:hypothetical protein
MTNIKEIQHVRELNIISNIITGVQLLKMVSLCSYNLKSLLIRVITKLPNTEQSYKAHKYINRQNQSTTGKL